MKRLTKWFGEGENRVAGVADDLEEKYTPEEIIDILLAALAPYEDTGLEPEEIREAYSKGWHSALDIIANLGTLDHFRELIQAEQDGRLVVLPCKVPTKQTNGSDAIYVIDDGEVYDDYVTEFSIGLDNDGCQAVLIETYDGRWLRDLDFGKTVFLNEEDAEAALEAQKGGGEK